MGQIFGIKKNINSKRRVATDPDIIFQNILLKKITLAKTTQRKRNLDFTSGTLGKL